MSRTPSSRRGFTIVELMLVVSAVSLVLGLCAGLLHVLLRLDRIGRSHLAETATVGRLARQFRNDVHAATGAKRLDVGDGPASKLELNLPGGRIILYEGREHALIRTQHQRDENDRRETYALPSCQGPWFFVQDADQKAWVSLRLPRGAGPDSDPKRLRHDLQIDALAGRDHRLSRPKETRP
jgi:prepilin-type N-terminal cleavage/methylation domain-containing protein